MSFIYKKPNSRYWYARFYDKDGKRCSRSTKVVSRGVSSRKDAQRIAEEFEEAARKRRTAKQTREVIVSLHQKITGEDLPVASLAKHLETWLAKKKPEVSSATYSFYAGVRKKLEDYFGDRMSDDMNNFVRQDITSFRNELSSRLAANTVNHHIKVVRMVFKDALRDGFVLENPAEHVDAVKDDKSSKLKRKPFAIQELRLVMEHATSEWRSMILFGLYTGQRLGDIVRLRWSQIDLNRGVIYLVTGKTGKRLHIPLAKPLLEHIGTLPAGDDPEECIHPRAYELLQSSAGGKVTTLSNQFTKILEHAGLREKTTHQKKGQGRSAKRQAMQLSFHSLRHTAVSLMHEAGIPAASVQALIGHDSEAVHQAYTHIGDEALRKAADSLPRL